MAKNQLIFSHCIRIRTKLSNNFVFAINPLQNNFFYETLHLSGGGGVRNNLLIGVSKEIQDLHLLVFFNKKKNQCL